VTDTWDHRILIVIISLVGKKIIFVQLFLNVAHVSSSTKVSLGHDLGIKLILIAHLVLLFRLHLLQVVARIKSPETLLLRLVVLSLDNFGLVFHHVCGDHLLSELLVVVFLLVGSEVGYHLGTVVESILVEHFVNHRVLGLHDGLLS
jgi:hypothetical protein